MSNSLNDFSKPAEAGLWDAGCVGRAAVAAVGAASAAGILGLIANFWPTVVFVLAWLVGAGGFWHSFSIPAGLALVSLYFACVSWKRDPRKAACHAAQGLAVLFALGAVFALICVLVSWAESTWPCVDCLEGQWRYASEHRAEVWRVSAMAIVFFVAVAGAVAAVNRTPDSDGAA